MSSASPGPPVVTVEEGAFLLARGGVIAFPTDTVFGLACDARNADAVSRIYAIKGRPEEMELTLMVATLESADPYVLWSDEAKLLASAFLPGALALILPRGETPLAIPKRGTTLALRIPDHPAVLGLAADIPLATTSANVHGEKAAVDVEGALQLGGAIDAVVGGACQAGIASTMIDCTGNPFRRIRNGPISWERIDAALGTPTIQRDG